ncbi:MAG: phage holin family protein [Candidatus Marinimicrobia bacterium]|nr:phage holin family protein [Candidatus Neomarinimicrobiota bacterium]MCF7828253.1 phage holin family protein [Candidatus Neomarinimicrobiota bacterium]MCF7879572.1 phage holin family protein [Candidatus Neomarinimicrobiota bacterium]
MRRNPFLTRWFVTFCAVLLTERILPGIHAEGVLTLIVTALLLGILNAVLRPVLLVITLPITIMTFGLFALVVNGIVLALTSVLIPGFFVAGFWSAVFGALLISIAGALINQLMKNP